MAEELKLASVFGSNMVLQRGGPIRLWGWGKAGAQVTAQLAGGTAETTVGTNGKWKLELPEVAAGGPYEASIKSDGQEARLSNVLVGDVWLCSGQSNMEWTVAACGPENAPKPEKSHPTIRLLTVARESASTPVDHIGGRWQGATPDTILNFSAVGFFFGRELEKELNVPIGLIASSWGGTPAEAWTPVDDLAGDLSLAYLAERPMPAAAKAPHVDPGNLAFGEGWAKRDADESAWKPITLPTLWQSVGMPHNGAVWFRKHVRLPAAWAGKSLKVSLGAIDDFDVTYFNNHEVGAIGAETAAFWTTPREYVVPDRFTREGDNVITVRVFDQWGNGGFVGPGVRMKIAPVDSPDEAISLAGDWLCRVEHELPLSTSDGGVGTSTLYNGMIHPIQGLSMKGAIWYQGESNAGRADQYENLLTTMIRSWRRRWNVGDFPFLIVQLANFAQQDHVSASPWAELREAQHRVATNEINCAIASAIDIGETNDIHPRNKLDVGRRLAHEALRLAYARTGTPRSPVYREHTVEGSRVTLQFDHAEHGLISNGAVRGFDIAGSDQVFYPADASIVAGAVVVQSSRVAEPASVRYAWRGDPDNNLRAANGLPALPFRTDDWPRTTTGAR